mmetsp:Transcript_38728/g.56549  ORF Transcript_38728/g.56549 Transcript_38728/m.56549 type:complete len:235 (-) Transcript_38728:339-1043(-)
MHDREEEGAVAGVSKLAFSQEIVTPCLHYFLGTLVNLSFFAEGWSPLRRSQLGPSLALVSDARMFGRWAETVAGKREENRVEPAELGNARRRCLGAVFVSFCGRQHIPPVHAAEEKLFYHRHLSRFCPPVVSQCGECYPTIPGAYSMVHACAEFFLSYLLCCGNDHHHGANVDFFHCQHLPHHKARWPWPLKNRGHSVRELFPVLDPFPSPLLTPIVPVAHLECRTFFYPALTD